MAEDPSKNPDLKPPGGEGTGSAEQYKDAPLGKKLGSGGNKDVFAVEGDDQHAIAILRKGKSPESLNEEIALIKKLEGEGVPAVEILGTTTHDGQPAVVMERYALGSKSVVKLEGGKVRIVGDSELLNERSLADLQRIKSTMVDDKIKVNDLQFLIGSDGRVVVADPLDVIIGEAPSKNNVRMLDLLMEVARKNIQKPQ